ncbi:MAG: ABC transporter substrate-binding protein [Anaerolineae bacterium]|jgi:branched-chain amino acid transport system substrate-binding protein
MKPRWTTWLAVVLVAALMLSACTAPTTGTTPQPTTEGTTPAETETQAPTAAPEAEVRTYVVATDAAFPPMEFVDENKAIAGFDIDLLNAIAEEMGFQVEWKNTAWDGIFAGLESGDYDVIISSVTIRDDRTAVYDFTEPYINAGQAIVVTADDTTIMGKDDLAGKKLGAQIGTTGAFTIEEITGSPAAEYDTIDLAFHDLVAGNLDAVIVDTPVAADYALASDQFAGKLKIVGDTLTEEFYGALVKKGENAEFISMFNEGLAKVKASGVYDEIYAKWISGEAAGGSAGEEASGAAGESSVAPAPGFPVRIAVLAALSGDVKTFGESARNGAMMAFDEARAAGWEIETIVEDSRCDAQEAANAANKVIFEDQVHYILGPVCSSASIPVSEIAQANEVLMLTATSTSPSVTINEDGTNKDFVFRGCFLDPFQAQVAATLANELGATNAAVLFDIGNDYVKGLAEYFKTYFEEKGGTVSVFEAYTKDDTDFSAILGKVAAAAPDVIYLPDYYAKNNLIAAQIKEKGIEATLLGADGWDSPDLQIDLFEGGYFSNHYSPNDPRPLVQNFVAAYTEQYGAAPDALATLAYDGAKILLQAISEAGVDDPAAVRDAMWALHYEGVSGEITYNEFGDPIKTAAIIKIENGKPVFYKFVAP